LHYFKRPKGCDFFGEERGAYPLNTIKSAVLRENKPDCQDGAAKCREFEVNFLHETKIVIRSDTGAKADEWIDAILKAQAKDKKGIVRKNTITGNFMSGDSPIGTIKVMAVIMHDKKHHEERLVTRAMATGKKVDFGALPKDGGRSSIVSSFFRQFVFCLFFSTFLHSFIPASRLSCIPSFLPMFSLRPPFHPCPPPPRLILF
jgi:hypothetical protein